MTDLQEIKYSMFIAVRDFISAHAAELSSLPSFTDFSEQFDSIIGQIREIRSKQEINRAGDTLDKAELKKELTALAFEMSRKLVAHANLVNKNSIKVAVDFTPSELRNASDTIFLDRCDIICQHANTYIEELTSASFTYLIGLK